MFEVISQKLNIPVEQLRLVVLNHCFEHTEEKTLQDYDIVDKTTVHIVQRVHGGSEPSEGKCCITKAQLPMKDLIKMSCGHTFSPIALADYLDNTISKETKLICPVPECKKNWKQAEISGSGLTEEKIQEILKSIATNLMFSLYNCKRCPKCDTLTERINEDRLRTECLICSRGCKHMVCTICKIEFCFACLSIKDKAKGEWPESCGTWRSKCTVAPRQKKIPDKKKK